MNSAPYETGLRAVGQALEGLNVQSFSLELSFDENYTVHGVFEGSPLQFSQEKLTELEKQGQARRSNSNGSPNPHSLAQTLRTVGAYVDQKKRRLINLSCSGDRVVIRYEQPMGDEKTEEFTRPNLYDLWVHMYKLRGGAARTQKNSNRVAI
jgi:hypothetical protein